MKKTTLILSLVLFTMSCYSQIPSNGLVAYWPFNGNANDSSIYNNNGVVTGATLTVDRFGNPNKAYSFNGSSDFITVPDNAVMFADTLTLSWWYRVPNYTGIRVVIGWVYGGNRYQQFFDGQSFSYFNGYSNSCCYFNPISILYGTNVWQHIVVTYEKIDPTLAITRLFVNGILVQTDSHSMPITYQPGYDLFIGKTHDQGNFNGEIDDVGIWNRALSQQEITDLYNACQLSIETQPVSQTININTNADFIVSSSNPSVTYQWQTEIGLGFQNLNNGGQYSGTNDDTLTITNSNMSNNNQPFRCIISSGSCSDTSNIAVLTVNNNGGVTEFFNTNLFSIYPIPATVYLNLNILDNTSTFEVKIINLLGETEATFKTTDNLTVIDISKLTAGVYVLEVSFGNSIERQKFVKE